MKIEKKNNVTKRQEYNINEVKWNWLIKTLGVWNVGCAVKKQDGKTVQSS